jgi:hypothetical protein
MSLWMRVFAAPGRLAGLLLGVALVLLALPVVSARMPPLNDYPNHFARIWLLAGGAETAPVSDFYAVDWTGASTNIGLDLATAALGSVLPAEVLAPMFLIAALVLPPLGAAALNRALFGGWHWWQVGFAALAWSATLLAGFLNFQIGLGLALLAAAADPALARLGPARAFAVRAALAAVLLLVHIFALLFYAGLLAGLAAGPRWRGIVGSRRDLARSAGRAAGTIAAAALPAAALLLLAQALPGAHPGAGAGHESAPFSVWEKAGLLLSSVRNYRRGLDLALVALLAAPALWAAATGRLRGHAGLLLTAAGFVALLFASPGRLAGTVWIEERFPVMAALTLAAALRPDPVPSRRAMAVLAVALLAVSATRTALVAQVWRERQADVAALERALARLPVGARLLPMEHTPAGGVKEAPRGRFLFSGGDLWRNPRAWGTYWHYPTLAVPWRRAFVPTLFAMRGKQPVRALPPWDALMVPDGIPVSVGALRADDPTKDERLRGFSVHHLARWRESFEYVLVLNADMPDGAGPARPVPGLELVADEGFAQLHRIVPTAGPHRAAQADFQPDTPPSGRAGPVGPGPRGATGVLGMASPGAGGQ